ncbi:hypothetical protein A2U01_0055880, partial [Trifolium medium]|nr:hypothetical protein [Trifolium medium]
FKERYYAVRQITSKGWKSIVYRGPTKDEDNNVVMGPDGKPVEEDFAQFHFHWNLGHYLISSNEFTFKRTALSPDEVADYDRLVDFVRTFPANLLEDSEGNPLLDDNGQQKTSAKLIHIKRLLGCKTQTDLVAFFRMSAR